MTAPLLTPEQAGSLLDEVVFERVLECVDLDELYRFEQEINGALFSCGLETEAVITATDELIARALVRLSHDERRWFTRGPTLGSGYAPPGGDDCPLCEDVAREEQRAEQADRSMRIERARRRNAS